MQEMGSVVSDVTLNMMKRRVLFKKPNGEQETPEDAYKRVARFVATGHAKFSPNDTKRFESQAVEMMSDGKFMPNTPTLVNAGFPNAQCSACFVLPIEDNLKSIYKAHYDQGLTHASGGGTGFSLSNIRPNGSTTSSRFITKGPVSWLKMLNENSSHVVQGMREGANMAMLDIGHPDIVEFITCKKSGYNLQVEDLAERFNTSLEEAVRIKSIIGIEKFNISVAIPDVFMQTLERSGDWYFIDPHTKKRTKSIPAKELWDLIVKNAHEHGEPGVFFIDEANRYNKIPHKGRIVATNPCVIGSTFVQTDRGLEHMDDLIEESRLDTLIMGMTGQWRKVKEYHDNGIKPVWKVITRSGYSVTVTAEHKFPIVGQSELVELQNLHVGQKLYLSPTEGKFGINGDPLAFELLGWLVGDGYISKSDSGCGAGITVGGPDNNLLPWFIETINKVVNTKCRTYDRPEYNSIQISSKKLGSWAINMGAHAVRAGHKCVPNTVWTANRESILAFLRGLFSADGHLRINDRHGHAVVLSSKSKHLVSDVQILLSMFGMRASVLDRSRPPRENLFTYITSSGEIHKYGSDGEMYEIHLRGRARQFFKDEIKFTAGSYKNEKLKELQGVGNSNFKGAEFDDEIISIEYVGEENVYDITVDDPHDLTMINNGLVTWDCGESPLNAYGSCNLGHINLSKYIAGTNGTSQINYSGLEEVIRFGIQFLDNIIEINTLPIPELVEMNTGTRQIGLGIMGWADALIKMGIKYDSDDAIKKINEVGEFFDKISLDESQKLGKDRGNFPYFEGSYWYKNGYKNMRNSDRTTIAPTGQTSMYAGCSSGIEPIMFPVMRREQAGMIQIDYHPILFNMLKDRGLDTQEIKDKLGIIGSVRGANFIPDDIKELFPSAHDIHYTWHVKHQATWQKYVTLAVSKTINFPKEAVVSDIADSYLLAYKNKCKGITVYRDGSRLNQPLSSLKRGTILGTKKRSEVTHGTNRKVPTGCGNLMIYVGEDDNGCVQEITARLGKGGGCASSQTEAIARVASIAIQHGVDPAYIAKQLSGIRCHLSAFHKSKYTGDRPRAVTSCADAVSVALSEHLSNGSNKKIDVPDKIDKHSGACPGCGGQLIFEEGCSKCYNCDFSRC